MVRWPTSSSGACCGFFQVFGFFRRPVNVQDRGQMYLYSLGNNKAQRNGKPPPESRKRLLECNAFSDISSKTKGGSTSVVITDGAPVYPRLCRDHKLKHLSCNHSKGIFCTTKKNRDGTSVEVHTGSIDAMWRLCKMCIPPSLSSKNTSSLMRHLRQWQWRWSNGNKDLAQKLGKAIS